MNLPRYQDTDRLLGYCHITFDSEKAYQNALKLNKSNLNGRYLDIKPSTGFKKKKIDLDALKQKIKENDSKTIFVKNISY